MEHDHSHAPGPAHPPSRRLRLLLAAILVPGAVAIVILAVVLHGRGPQARFPAGVGPSDGLVNATILTRHVNTCPGVNDAETGLPSPQIAHAPQPDETQCLTVTVRLTSGSHKGQTVRFDTASTRIQPFPHSGGVVLAYDKRSGGGLYTFADIQRGRPLSLLFLGFAIVVIAVARWTGLRALLGLGASFAVLVGFVLPALLAGSSALQVSLVGSAGVLFLALFLAHGVNVQTSIAVLGTLLSLLLCGALAQVFVIATSLTGLGSDEADLLASSSTIDLRGLLLAGVVIGALGAIIDMTVTQASAVWQLHSANPTATGRDLYTAAMRVGRDHVAAATTTLVLAYAGTALPLMIIYQLAHTQLTSVVTSEVVAAEVVRTLVGAVGLVAAVPLTTALAALAVQADRKPGRTP